MAAGGGIRTDRRLDVKSANGEDLASFVEDCLARRAEASTSVDDLYHAYVAWCRARKHRPERKDELSRLLVVRLGLTKAWKGKNYLNGISLREE